MVNTPFLGLRGHFSNRFIESPTTADRAAQEERLQDVQQIAASFGAFCGVTGDGAAVAWGDPDFGGDARKMWVEMWEWGDGMGWKQLGGMREAVGSCEIHSVIRCVISHVVLF